MANSLKCRAFFIQHFYDIKHINDIINDSFGKSQTAYLLSLIILGVITRNSDADFGPENSRKILCDSLAVASIVSNCTGRDTSNNKQKCLGIEEFKEFLEFQEVTPTEEELMQIVQVMVYSHLWVLIPIPIPILSCTGQLDWNLNLTPGRVTS